MTEPLPLHRERAVGLVTQTIIAEHHLARCRARRLLRRNLKEHPIDTYQKFDFWVNIADFAQFDVPGAH